MCIAKELEGYGEGYAEYAKVILVNMGELACCDHAKRFVFDNGIADDNVYGVYISVFYVWFGCDWFELSG